MVPHKLDIVEDKILAMLRYLETLRVMSVVYDGEKDTYTIDRVGKDDEDIRIVVEGERLE